MLGIVLSGVAKLLTNCLQILLVSRFLVVKPFIPFCFALFPSRVFVERRVFVCIIPFFILLVRSSSTIRFVVFVLRRRGVIVLLFGLKVISPSCWTSAFFLRSYFYCDLLFCFNSAERESFNYFNNTFLIVNQLPCG